MTTRKRKPTLADFAPPSTAPAPASSPARATPATSPADSGERVAVMVRMSKDQRKRLQAYGLDADRSTQELGEEALNLLFTSRGLPPLFPAKG